MIFFGRGGAGALFKSLQYSTPLFDLYPHDKFSEIVLLAAFTDTETKALRTLDNCLRPCSQKVNSILNVFDSMTHLV